MIMMPLLPFFFFLFFLSFIFCYCFFGTIECIRYRFLYRIVFTPIFFYCLSHFISIGDLVLVQSEMILTFLYPQFNIDVYIPIYIIHALLSFLSFFSCNLKYSNGRFFLFFSSYLLFFWLKTEESFIMIWIAFISITPFSFFFLILFFSFSFP